MASFPTVHVGAMRVNIAWVQLLLCMLLWATTPDALIAQLNLRVELFRPEENPNNITLSCRVSGNPMNGADFWVNSTGNDLTHILSNYTKIMGRIEFFLDPTIEGTYYCGNISAGIRSTNNFTLMGV